MKFVDVWDNNFAGPYEVSILRNMVRVGENIVLNKGFELWDVPTLSKIGLFYVDEGEILKEANAMLYIMDRLGITDKRYKVSTDPIVRMTRKGSDTFSISAALYTSKKFDSGLIIETDGKEIYSCAPEFKEEGSYMYAPEFAMKLSFNAQALLGDKDLADENANPKKVLKAVDKAIKKLESEGEDTFGYDVVRIEFTVPVALVEVESGKKSAYFKTLACVDDAYACIKLLKIFKDLLKDEIKKQEGNGNGKQKNS